MLNRIMISASNYSSVIVDKVKSKLSNKNGMEMLQMIIILGIAVILGAGVYALVNAYIGDESGTKGIMGKIGEKLSKLADMK